MLVLTALPLFTWHAAAPGPRALVSRHRACAMVGVTARKTFTPADFPASWPYAAADFTRIDEQPDVCAACFEFVLRRFRTMSS